MSNSPSLPLVEGEKPTGPIQVGKAIHPAFYIANWIFFSNVTILFNKWLLDTAGFKYPVTLTCWHLVFATVATQLIARFSSLLDNRHEVKMTAKMYLRAIVPIGLLYSGSLVCSNLVYLYLSVAFIQMLKAASPVAVLITSWIWRVADPSMDTFLNVLIIVLGVGMASYGEIEFSLIGFFFQVAGTIFEAIRLVMIQVLLKGEGAAQKMDPLLSLYYYAPVCALTNLLVAAAVEFRDFDWEDLSRTGPFILLANATVAFLLNIASVFLIGKTSGLVMTLTGILKNILLIVASVFLWNTSITTMQFIGYAVALSGLVIYSTGLDQLKTHVVTAWAWARNAGSSWTPLSTKGEDDEEGEGSGHRSPWVKRVVFMVFAAVVSAMLVAGYFYGGTIGASFGSQTPVEQADGQ